MNHEALEKNVGLLMAFILVAISVGGMVQIFPLIFSGNLSQPIDTLKPLTAVQLEGRDIYIREGCGTCHTQMVRTLQHETARYGHYSVAGEDAYERPFLWGSSALDRIWRGLAAATVMLGMPRTFWIRAAWCRCPTCQPTHGYFATFWTARSPRRKCGHCKPWEYLIATSTLKTLSPP